MALPVSFTCVILAHEYVVRHKRRSWVILQGQFSQPSQKVLVRVSLCRLSLQVGQTQIAFGFTFFAITWSQPLLLPWSTLIAMGMFDTLASGNRTGEKEKYAGVVW